MFGLMGKTSDFRIQSLDFNIPEFLKSMARPSAPFPWSAPAERGSDGAFEHQ
jgi:hypothetical protein